MRLFRSSSIPAGIVALGALLLLTGVTSRHAQAPAGPETAHLQATVHASPDAATTKTTHSTPWTVVGDVRLSDADGEELSSPLSSLDSSVPRPNRVPGAGSDSARGTIRAPSCATLCVFLC
jgi:hypothetical protein